MLSGRDDGEYICRVEYSNGYLDQQIAYIYVEENSNPLPTDFEIISINPDNSRVTQGQTVTLQCSSSDPSVRLNWTKIQGSLPANSQQDGRGKLILYQMTVEDSGLYLCSSGENGISSQARIIVEPVYVDPPVARFDILSFKKQLFG